MFRLLYLTILFCFTQNAFGQWSIGFDFGFSISGRKRPSSAPTKPNTPPPPALQALNITTVEGNSGFYKKYSSQLGLLYGLGSFVAISGDGKSILAGAPMSWGPDSSGWEGLNSGSAIDLKKGPDNKWYLGPPIASNYAFGKAIPDKASRNLGSSVDVNKDGSLYLISSSTSAVLNWWDTNLKKKWSVYIIRKDKACGSKDVNSKCDYILEAGPFDGQTVSISDFGSSFVTGDPSFAPFGGAWVYTADARSKNWNWNTSRVALPVNGSIGTSSFGSSVAMSGDENTIVVGGPNDDNGSGAAWIFVRNKDSTWKFVKKIVGTQSVGKAKQGTSVSIDRVGNTVVLGGPEDNNKIGASWIFVRDKSGEWIQRQKLVGEGYIGPSLQGKAVSLSGDGKTLIVGAPGNDSNYGAFWVFALNSSNTWEEKDWFTFKNQYLTPGTRPDGRIVSPPEFGGSVSLSDDGRTAVIGSQKAYAGFGTIFTLNFKVN